MRKAPRKGAFSAAVRDTAGLTVDDGGVLSATASCSVATPEPAPARPEDERGDQADDTDDHEDHACDLDVDAGNLCVDGPGQDCTNCDQQDAEADSHDDPFP